MVIAFDFDGTITEDPVLFGSFVTLAQGRGHTVIIVTSRAESMGKEVRDLCGKWGIPIIYAGKAWKRDAAIRAGYQVDVWADDMPEYVGPAVKLLGQNRSQIVSDQTMALLRLAVRLLKNVWRMIRRDKAT